MKKKFGKAIKKDGYIYMMSYDSESLYRIKYGGNLLEYVCSLDATSKDEEVVFLTLAEYGNKLVFFPLYSNEIVVHNLVNKENKKHILKKIDENGYFEPYIKQGDIWLFSATLGMAVYKYNIESEELFEECELEEKIKAFCPEGGCRTNVASNVEDNKICMGVFGTDAVMIIDLSNNNINKYSIGNVSITNVEMHNGNIWIADSENNKVVKYNLSSKEKKEYKNEDAKKCRRVFICDEKPYVLCLNSNSIHYIDEEKGKILANRVYELEDDFFYNVSIIGENELLYTGSTGMIIYSLLDKTYKCIKYDYSNVLKNIEKEKRERINCFYNKKNCVNEVSIGYDLNDLLEIDSSNMRMHKDNSNGEQIFKSIK